MGWRSLVLVYGLIFAFILLFSFFPLIAALGSGAVAEWAGCRLDEGGTYPCIIGGVNYGDTLAFLFILGWLSLVTIPFGMAVLGIWFIVLVIHLLIRLISNRPQTSRNSKPQ